MSVAPVSPYMSPLYEAGHRNSFLGSLKSEMRKIRMRTVLVSSAMAILGYALIIWFISNPEFVSGSGGISEMLLGWNILSIFVVVIGAVAVTSEYSSNTMRTTVLADPNRTRVFFAKFTAVFIYAFVLALVIGLISTLIGWIRLNGIGFTIDTNGFIALGLYSLVLASIAVITMGFGFALRSTAGTITVMVLLLFFADFFSLFPYDFFREVLPKYFLTNVSNELIFGSANQEMMGPVLGSQGMAGLVLLAYVVVACGLGLATFKRRDI